MKHPISVEVSDGIDSNDPPEVQLGKENESVDGDGDIDRVIRGFQQELDSLSRSFDLLTRSHGRTTAVIDSSEKSSAVNGKFERDHNTTASELFGVARTPSEPRFRSNRSPARGGNCGVNDNKEKSSNKSNYASDKIILIKDPVRHQNHRGLSIHRWHQPQKHLLGDIMSVKCKTSIVETSAICR